VSDVRVIKLIVVADSDTSDLIELLADLSPREREARSEAFGLTDAEGGSHKLHFVHAEVV
jgi:hypothetical protein